ncbi:hypothetical protein IVB09_18245, partial [Bradyrhizobium sp. 174]|nr:hypothetical protein [Bradyrhizobium sp. 174]
MSGTKVDGETVLRAACTGDAQALYDVTAQSVQGCGFRGLRPEIPIERDHAFRSKAATCSDEGGRGV